MKALVLSEYKQLDLVDMAMPQPGEDDLLIRVQACGICGSDVHGYDGSTGRRLPPVVMGHEAAGVVETVGGAWKVFSPATTSRLTPRSSAAVAFIVVEVK